MKHAIMPVDYNIRIMIHGTPEETKGLVGPLGHMTMKAPGEVFDRILRYYVIELCSQPD